LPDDGWLCYNQIARISELERGNAMANERNYLIFEDVQKDRSLKSYFETCVSAVFDGTARIIKAKPRPGYTQPDCIKGNGKDVLLDAILPYYLWELAIAGFDYKKARDFAERMRKLAGFSYSVRYPLEQWVYSCLRNPYFHNVAEKDSFTEEWVLNPDEAHDFIPEDFFKFACYVAILHLKYGASYESVTANEIFRLVTELGSDLPAKMKKNGSGDMPKELLEYKDDNLSCKANDAFATIKITMKEESETHYEKALDFLCALLKVDFPCSYSIDFRSPEKNVLPIKGLTKRGVHHFFANAARYPGLYNKVEKYARLAMKEDEWYNNCEDENCAMPGTFAVFALGITSEVYAPLVIDYLDLCDDEHSMIQEKFIVAYIGKYGFTESSVRVFLAGVESMRELPTNKVYAEAVNNEEILHYLLNAKKNVDEYVWQGAIYAIWGKDAVYNKGDKIIKKADPTLRPLYEKVLKG